MGVFLGGHCYAYREGRFLLFAQGAFFLFCYLIYSWARSSSANIMNGCMSLLVSSSLGLSGWRSKGFFLFYYDDSSYQH